MTRDAGTLLLLMLCAVNHPQAMRSTLRFALRWQLVPLGTRLRLIRLLMRWNPNLVAMVSIAPGVDESQEVLI